MYAFCVIGACQWCGLVMLTITNVIRMNLLLCFFAILSAGLVGAAKNKKCATLKYEKTDETLEIFVGQRSIQKHAIDRPAIDLGIGRADYRNDLGNFLIENKVEKRIPLPNFEVIANKDQVVEDAGPVSGSSKTLEIIYSANSDDVPQVSVKFSCTTYGNTLMRVRTLQLKDKRQYNRVWVRMTADPQEKVYGGGEQYTYFQMRGHAFPMWVREQGVGRDYSKLTTNIAEWVAGAGGDYHTTYWPQPTYVSSRLLYVHVNHSYYNVLNFTQADYHELELWERISSVKVYVDVAESWPALLTKLTSFIGRQPTPPEWIYDGAIIGIQGGKNEVTKKYNLLRERGVKISAVWIQDWSGKLVTSLGKRVYWNWEIDEDFYWSRETTQVVLNLYRANGVRFLTYINPHIIEGSKLYKFADHKGLFIKNATTGKTLLVDFGEFSCGTVDLTNPSAYNWYKIILKAMLRLGFSGWMADFGGEYLPVDTDVSYHSKRIAATGMHNYYSYLWAKLNNEVVKESGMEQEALIFMRSGYAASPGQTRMAWAGDQNVDYFYGDGLPSVIPATLSLGMSGMGLSHSDIGGYVSLINMVRNEELIVRWSEMSAFTPVMRTHEGNRPDRNWQIYTTNKTVDDFARLVKLYTLLKPYHQFVAEQNTKHGWPTQRPLFFAYPDDEKAYDIQYQYLYGPDLLVAPVFVEGAREWDVYLPADNWIYMWGDLIYQLKSKDGAYVTVKAPLGRPPVFYREGTEWIELFQELRSEMKETIEEPPGLSWSLLLSNPLIFLYLLLRKLFYFILHY